MIECKHKIEGICSIATNLCGKSVVANEDACIECCKCSVPKSENFVTASIAVSTCRIIDGREKAKILFNTLQASGIFSLGKVATQFGDGPGTTLHNLFTSKGYHISPGCKCVDTILKMNSGGIEWCYNNLSTIVQSITDEAKRRQMHYPDLLIKIVAKRLVLTSLRLYGKSNTAN